MSSYNAFRNNLPVGFDGIEGQEENTYSFYIHGEVDVEHYNEEGAEEDIMDMTLRELVSRGLNIE